MLILATRPGIQNVRCDLRESSAGPARSLRPDFPANACCSAWPGRIGSAEPRFEDTVARNPSILAHGVAPVGENVYDQSYKQFSALGPLAQLTQLTQLTQLNGRVEAVWPLP